MKKLLAIAIAALCIAGCDDVPSAETVTVLSNTIGASAAMVVKLAGVDKTVVDNINNVLAIVDKVVPNKDQSFEDAWTPLIKEEVEKLLQKGKLNEAQAKLVTLGLNAAVKGLDRLFEKKPEWKKYDQVVVGAIGGFIEGFQSVLAPADDPASLAKSFQADPVEVKIIAERLKVEVK